MYSSCMPSIKIRRCSSEISSLGARGFGLWVSASVPTTSRKTQVVCQIAGPGTILVPQVQVKMFSLSLKHASVTVLNELLCFSLQVQLGVSF